ncbi:MAG: hypothetical protein OXG37_01145 [Actinomycetia bacterium]|nr:hypothetical protein [Actinomycetes bacterium]
MLAHLEPLQADGRFLLLLHHEGKDENRGPRGSSALGDQAGLTLQVSPVDEEQDAKGLCIVTPRKWRSGPLDSQPTLRLYVHPSGQVGADVHEPPDTAEKRHDAILAALIDHDEPATIRDLFSRTPGLPGGKVTARDLHALEADGMAHTHPPAGRSSHPLWMPGPSAECCPE